MDIKKIFPISLKPSHVDRIDMIKQLISEMVKQGVPKDRIQFVITSESKDLLLNESYLDLESSNSIFGHRVEWFDKKVIYHVYGQVAHIIAISDQRYFEDLVKRMEEYDLLIGGTHGTNA